MSFQIDLSKKFRRKDLEMFAAQLQQLQAQIGFKVSSRGWCYQLESERVINKDQFDKVETWINKCRKLGLLPIDFVAEEEGRQFSGVETPEWNTPTEFLKHYIEAPLKCWSWYTPDWWKDETYYIQMLVEKVDLKTLFEPVCEKFHIPIATSKGWSSMLQRAIYARRFREAEEQGLVCVLLYCGDHDPDGLRISDFIRKNLEDIKDIEWEDGTRGYNPEDLQIERFGLDASFIRKHNLTWIDNLITGSGGNLASDKHKNHFYQYVQDYLKKFGERKCEANAIVPIPDIARAYVQGVIEGYVGEDAEQRFIDKRLPIKEEMMEVIEKSGLRESIERSIKLIEDDE